MVIRRRRGVGRRWERQTEEAGGGGSPGFGDVEGFEHIGQRWLGLSDLRLRWLGGVMEGGDGEDGGDEKECRRCDDTAEGEVGRRGYFLEGVMEGGGKGAGQRGLVGRRGLQRRVVMVVHGGHTPGIP